MKPKKFQEANVVYGEGHPNTSHYQHIRRKKGRLFSVLNWTKQNEKK